MLTWSLFKLLPNALPSIPVSFNNVLFHKTREQAAAHVRAMTLRALEEEVEQTEGEFLVVKLSLTSDAMMLSSLKDEFLLSLALSMTLH
jgi:hypothetical protein